MKRLLFSLLILLSCASQVNAQSFSEEQLEGTWEFVDNGVEYNDFFGTIKKLTLGFYIEDDDPSVNVASGFIEFRWTEKMKELAKNDHHFTIDESETVLDYFITGNDRLHIIVGDNFALHFKILELDGNTLKLQTRKGVMVFTKTTTSVQQVKAETNKVEKTHYNLKGQKLERPQRGLNIVRMSNGKSQKVLR